MTKGYTSGFKVYLRPRHAYLTGQAMRRTETYGQTCSLH